MPPDKAPALSAWRKELMPNELKSLKVEDLAKIFGPEGVAALAATIKEQRKAERVEPLKVKTEPGDWAKALSALAGHINRDSMNALRRVALRYAVEQQEDFAGWLDEHAAAAEIEEGEADEVAAVTAETEHLELDGPEPVEEPDDLVEAETIDDTE